MVFLYRFSVTEMLNVETLPVAEEEVVESSSNKLGDIYSFVSKGSFPQSASPLRRKNLRRFARKFTIDEGKLYYVGTKKEEKREVVIEAERKRQIFLDCHFNDIGHHLGQKKTVHRIQSKYYWLGIIRDVVDWIKVCDTCQHAERSKNQARTIRPIKVDAPWEIIGIDFLGPFPETQQSHRSVFVALDYFTKWPEAFPVQRADALSAARCISKCIYRFGAPKTIVCNQNADFCEEVTKLLSERWSVTQNVSPLDQPHLNPLHDSTLPLLKEAVEQMVREKNADWDDFLDSILYRFRTSVNETTKFTPYSLVFSRNQMQLNLLSRNESNCDGCSTTCMSIMQEQQNCVKQLVVANMNAAYKQQKNAKRRTHHMTQMTLKMSNPEVVEGDSPSPKKERSSVYLSFSESVNTQLEYHLTDSDVH
uniref:Gypsy retrotransposon integrase-like protein 1 n=1 Tax=Gouania willdenowi TaxID=441366 RepID=A0A8C5HZK7_GOUWI